MLEIKSTVVQIFYYNKTLRAFLFRRTSQMGSAS
jgi:hypothetical protein